MQSCYRTYCRSVYDDIEAKSGCMTIFPPNWLDKNPINESVKEAVSKYLTVSGVINISWFDE
jgi:hypothetical protein